MTIYSDVLNPSWSLIGAQDEEINQRAKTLVHEGLFSIAITPKKSTSQIYFLLEPDTPETYPRAQVHGFRFRLNPGDHPMELSDLVVGILGGDDPTVFLDPETMSNGANTSTFSDTFLYTPGFDESIPPNTWSEMVIWFDDPISDSQFEYILGFFIQRGNSFLQTCFLDDVQLIVAGRKPLPTREPPTPTSTSTPTPSLTPTPTPTNTNTRVPRLPTLTPSKTEKPEKPDKPKDTKAPKPDPPTPTLAG